MAHCITPIPCQKPPLQPKIKQKTKGVPFDFSLIFGRRGGFWHGIEVIA